MTMSRYLSLSLEDTRRLTNGKQIISLDNRLKKDKVSLALNMTKSFLGKYSIRKINKIKIRIVEGKVGEGTIQDGVIELQLPPQTEAISQIKGFVETKLQGKTDEEIVLITQELVYALTASTVLHEGVHGLLDSKPGSRFAQDFESISGMPNEHGKTTTLLDEGIAYAVQGIYAPEIETIGSLTSVARESEQEQVRQRKLLGERLRPMVKSYIEQGRVVDERFIKTASEMIKSL